MMRLTLLAISTILLVPATLALQFNAGTDCIGVGTPCGFTVRGRLITGFCAPNNKCIDNGAVCQNDDQCYNYCGSDGKCGGVNALCNTQAPFSHGQEAVACLDALLCVNGGIEGAAGICVVRAGPTANARRHKARSDKEMAIHAEVQRRSYKGFQKRQLLGVVVPVRRSPVLEGEPLESSLSNRVLEAAVDLDNTSSTSTDTEGSSRGGHLALAALAQIGHSSE